jgi:hypothetical protein
MLNGRFLASMIIVVCRNWSVNGNSDGLRIKFEFQDKIDYYILATDKYVQVLLSNKKTTTKKQQQSVGSYEKFIYIFIC